MGPLCHTVTRWAVGLKVGASAGVEAAVTWPHGIQRLLGEAVWGADAVRDDVRGAGEYTTRITCSRCNGDISSHWPGDLVRENRGGSSDYLDVTVPAAAR